MRRFSALIGLSLCLGLPLIAAAKDSNPAALHVVGSHLEDSHGRIVRLQGVNIPSLEWSNGGDHILQSVQEAMIGWKANAIRLPLCEDRWFGQAEYQNDGGAAYRRLVDTTVQAIAANGGYVVLDCHWSDLGNWGHNIGQH